MNSQSPLIAHVIYRLDVGGLENGLVNLINHMPDSRYRHAIICLTDYTNFRNRIVRDVSVYALHKRPGNDVGLYWRLWRLFRKLRPDIVHTRNLATLEAQIPAMLAGVKHRIHGEHGWDIYDLEGKNKKYTYLKKIMRLIIGRYIPLSRQLAQYLQSVIGVKTEKLFHIYNGVDNVRFFPLAHRNDLVFPDGFITPNNIVIGTVGRLEAVKNPLLLVKAFNRLVNTDQLNQSRLRLVIIGDGSQRDSIEHFIEDAGLSGLVWLPGSRDDIPDLMQALDIFVLPSLAEGISNTILEAMACSLPIVATDVGGNAELIEQGKTGKLVPADEPLAMAKALGEYLTMPSMMRAHGAAGRVRIESEFSLDKMVQSYLAVYDSFF